MGKLAIVTGAGQGIGAAIAERLGKDGYAVAAVDINQQTVTEVVANLETQGITAKAYVIDIAKRADFFATVKQAVTELGELAVFVNNAGVAFIDSLVDSKPEDVERLFEVNIKGTYWGTQAAAEQFKAQGHGGRIINAASLAGVEASALQSAYSASKFAICGITESAAKELAADQITVNAYNPGVVRTPLRDAIDERTAKIKGKTIPEQQAAVLTEIGLGREGTPADVAELVAWLASPAAAYITGQPIMVDGGMHYL